MPQYLLDTYYVFGTQLIARYSKGKIKNNN